MRPIRLALTAALTTALCLSAIPAFAARPTPPTPPAPTSTPWSQLMGNAQHNGLSPYTGPTSSTIKWQYGAETPMGYSDNTQPVLAADGTIFVQTATGLYAFAKTGAIKWFLANSADRTFLRDHTPALGADGTLYTVANGASGTAVLALSSSGNEVWRSAVPTSYSAMSYLTVSTSGTIYFADPLGIIAIDPTGTQLWTNTDGNYGIAVSPDGGSGYAPDYNSVGGSIVKIDLVSGLTIWRRTVAALPHTGWGMLSVGTDGTVYVPESTTVRAFTPDGVQKWVWNENASVPGRVNECIVAQAPDGSLRVTTETYGDESFGRLAAIDGRTGTTKWVFVCDAGSGSSAGCITVDAAGKSYFTASYNWAPSQSYVYCVDARGRKVWSWKPFNDCYWFAPAIAADGVAHYFNGWDQRLYAFGRIK